MEAHDARSKRLEQIDRSRVDRSTRTGGAGLGQLETQFKVIGFERLAPAHFFGGLRFGYPIAEEVEIDGSRQRGERRNAASSRTPIKHGAGHGAQSAGFGNGHGESLVLDAGHWGLDDRKFGIKQRDHRTHGQAPSARPQCYADERLEPSQ